MIERICVATNSQEIECYLGGQDNFRYNIYPEYKGNRTKEKPHYLEACRETMVSQYKATIVNGYEADDALGIAQTKYDGGSRICSLDKDMLMIPGYHFNWVSGIERLVSPLDGLRTFYKQIILGDKSDNIPGYDGKLRSTCPQFIEKIMVPIDDMIDELDMYHYVAMVYGAIENQEQYDIMHRNAQLLYILKREDEYWEIPGLKVDEKDLSLVS